MKNINKGFMMKLSMTSKIVLGAIVAIAFLAGTITTATLAEAKPNTDGDGDGAMEGIIHEIVDILNHATYGLEEIHNAISNLASGILDIENKLDNVATSKGTSWLQHKLSVGDGESHDFIVANCPGGICEGHVNGRIQISDPAASVALQCFMFDGNILSSPYLVESFTGSSSASFSHDFSCYGSLFFAIEDGPNAGGTTVSASLVSGYTDTKDVTFNAEP